MWFGTAGGLASLQGATWTAFTPGNSGLPSVYAKDIEIDKFGNKWIATDKGVAVYREGGVVSIRELSTASAGLFLYPAYPNPANEFTTLKWHMRNPGQVRIMLYNQVGKEVIRIRNDKLNAGDQTERVNTSGLPAGVYIYRIETPILSKCGKLVIL